MIDLGLLEEKLMITAGHAKEGPSVGMDSCPRALPDAEGTQHTLTSSPKMSISVLTLSTSGWDPTALSFLRTAIRRREQFVQ